jgi:hypothetical protein
MEGDGGGDPGEAEGQLGEVGGIDFATGILGSQKEANRGDACSYACFRIIRVSKNSHITASRISLTASLASPRLCLASSTSYLATDRHPSQREDLVERHRAPSPRQIRCTWPEVTRPCRLHLREPNGLPRLSPATERLRGGSERWVAAARVTSPPEFSRAGEG